jgi:hypothetical protein
MTHPYIPFESKKTIRDSSNKVWVLDQTSKDEASLFIPFYVARRPWAPFCPRNYKDHRIQGNQAVCMLDASQPWQSTFKRKEKVQSTLRPEEQNDYEYGVSHSSFFLDLYTRRIKILSFYLSKNE